jgi:hypothetical protein
MSEDPTYINIIGIQKAPDESSYASNNNKIMTSGRILQEIDNAFIENTYNYVVEDLCIEVNEQPSSGDENSPLYKYYNDTLYIKAVSSPYSYSEAELSTAPDYIFVYTEDATPYYTLYEKKINTTIEPATFNYVLCKTNPSSIVLVKRYEDIYTLYDTDYSEEPTGNPQTWIKTDRFNEDLQINLTHTPISLTTIGSTIVGYDKTSGTGKISLSPDNGISATDSTSESGVTTSYVLDLLKDAISSGSAHTGTSIEVAYKVKDTSTPTNNVTNSVKISSIDTTIDAGEDDPVPGASIVVTGDKSYIETPILRLKIVE